MSQLKQALQSLGDKFGSRFNATTAMRESHGRDESWHEAALPDAVIFPQSTTEVQQVVAICAQHNVPIIPWGTGTGLEGAVCAVRGGVSIDLSEMNSIIAVHPEDLDVVVQPAVSHRALNQHLKTSGLFFPVDPGADASLGGMAATRASGTNAVRYGTMRENVLALEVVLADGRVIRTGTRAKKSSAGYDLTRLFVGSEGTLGVITELSLRLFGTPESIAVAVCPFDTLEGAVETVIATIQSGIPVARIELLDDLQIKSINDFSGLSLPEQNTLFLEFHGSENSTKEQALFVESIASELGGGEFLWRTKTEERQELWRARHNVAYACKKLRPGAELWATDVCVPISRLAECILETKRDLAKTSLLAPLVGHVGDGNFHLTILVKPEIASEVEEAKRLNERLIERAIAMDGTCTGEHGVGLGKRQYLLKEHGEGLDVMRMIKDTLDPHCLMNPGKIFPDN
jgi:D-lactate dehydrogenase (cytochrome)